MVLRVGKKSEIRLKSENFDPCLRLSSKLDNLLHPYICILIILKKKATANSKDHLTKCCYYIVACLSWGISIITTLVSEETPDVNVHCERAPFIHDIHDVWWDCIHFLIGVDSLKSANFLLTLWLLQSCLSICQPMTCYRKYQTDSVSDIGEHWSLCSAQ